MTGALAIFYMCLGAVIFTAISTAIAILTDKVYAKELIQLQALLLATMIIMIALSYVMAL